MLLLATPLNEPPAIWSALEEGLASFTLSSPAAMVFEERRAVPRCGEWHQKLHIYSKKMYSFLDDVCG
jgi:hypothetical protein